MYNVPNHCPRSIQIFPNYGKNIFRKIIDVKIFKKKLSQ